MFVTTVKELKRNIGKTVSLQLQGEADTKHIERHMTPLDKVDGVSLYLNSMDNNLYYVDRENKLYEVVARNKKAISALKVVCNLSQLDKQLNEGNVTFGAFKCLETLESVNSFMSTHLVLDNGGIERLGEDALLTRTLFKDMTDVIELDVLYDDDGRFQTAIATVIEKRI